VGFLPLKLPQFLVDFHVLIICCLFSPLVGIGCLLEKAVHHGSLEDMRAARLLFDLLVGFLLLSDVHLLGHLD
jgi:hypothetical protein